MKGLFQYIFSQISSLYGIDLYLCGNDTVSITFYSGEYLIEHVFEWYIYILSIC
jgi:hypothetical protein